MGKRRGFMGWGKTFIELYHVLTYTLPVILISTLGGMVLPFYKRGN